MADSGKNEELLGRDSAGAAEKSAPVTLETLFVACRVGDVDIIRSVVTDYHINVDSVDKYGWTALHVATLHNQTEAVFVLKELGAITNGSYDGFIPADMRPELFGEMQDTWQVPDTLEETQRELKPHMDLNHPEFDLVWINRMVRATDKFGKDLWESSIEYGDGDTPEINSLLFMGAKSGSLWFCRMCSERGVNIIHARTTWDDTTLHMACKSKQPQCVRFLLDHGADPNAKGISGNTPLHVACAEGLIESVSHLIYYKADPFQLDYHGETLLHSACRHGNVYGVQFCLAWHLDVNQANKHGKTPLHTACAWGQPECVQLLLNNGAFIEAKDHHGDTPLIIACAKGFTECVRLLLDKDANPNQPSGDERRQTPLWIACFIDNPECVSLLLEKGAHPNQPVDHVMNTPWKIASDENHMECVRLLEEHLRNRRN